jgi:hypothetical protein
MKGIWKFPINGITSIKAEEDAKVLSSGLDPQGVPCVWIMLDPAKEKNKTIEIFLIGTGFEFYGKMNENLKFLNTFVEGEYVWHTFVANG